MRVVLLTGPDAFEITTVDDPTPGEADVIVDVAASGICGTDLHIMSGELGHDFPFIPGHEFSGVVTALGSAVSTLRVGDRVVVDPGLPCHTCSSCRAGVENQCSRRGGLGETHDGGAAEFARVPADNAILLPDSLGTGDASFVEPVACAVHGLDSVGPVVGQHVLVLGAGTMGLVLTQLLAASGAASVSVIDIAEDRATAALHMGAAQVGTGPETLDRPQGWDVVVEASGSAGAVSVALESVARTGRLLQFGMASPSARVALTPYDVFDREITIVGSKSYLHSFERSIDLLAAGIMDVSYLITHRLPLEDYETALNLLRNGAGRKIQVVPG